MAECCHDANVLAVIPNGHNKLCCLILFLVVLQNSCLLFPVEVSIPFESLHIRDTIAVPFKQVQWMLLVVITAALVIQQREEGGHVQ